MPNPNDALPTLFRGLWKKHTDAEQGGTPLPELAIAPHVTQNSENGQYQVLNTRLWYSVQDQSASATAWDGDAGPFLDLDYSTLTTALRPFQSRPVRITDAVRRMLESENPDLGVLQSGRQLVEKAIRGALAAEIATEVAALTNAGTIDLTTTTTDVGKFLAEYADTIQENTGAERANFVFCCGRKALTRMKTNNDIIKEYVGRASTGGATAGIVNDAGVRQYFREVADCELIVIDRVTGDASGTAGFQWSTTAFFGVSQAGDLPSCLKTCSPDADLYELHIDRLRAFEKGGPGDVMIAKGSLDVVTADSSLGANWTLTL
jgi:hypothetical protein